MYLGWGGHVCADNPECRPPMGPRQRGVATLTTQVLDGLEYVADEAEQECQDADVQPSVLRALIDEARRLDTLQRAIASEPQVHPGACYAPPIARALAASFGADPDDVPIADWVAGRGRRAIALSLGAGPGTTPLSDTED
jgi:hypothetical protein